MKIFHYLIFLSLSTLTSKAQTQEWLLPVPGDPALKSFYGSSFSLQTKESLCWAFRTQNSNPLTINMFNGTQWKSIPVTPFIYDAINMDEQNDSIVLVGEDNSYNKILLYNGTQWSSISKLSAISGSHQNFNGLGIQDVRFYHNKLYAIVLNSDILSTLIEYDFKNDAIKTVQTFQQNTANYIYNQSSKMTMYVHQDRLYLAGAYDSVNHVASQGFGYYDGKSFINKRLFSTNFPTNFTVVKQIDSNTFALQRPLLVGNDASAYKLYLMQNDSIIKDITGDLFTTYKNNFGTIELSQDNLEIFLLNGKITYSDRYFTPFMQYDAVQNKWYATGYSANESFSFFFKNQHYVFCSEMKLPYTTKGKGCFVVKSSLSVSGTAYVDMDSNCSMTQKDSVIKKEWITMRSDSSMYSVLTDKNGAYGIPISLGKYWFESPYKSLTASVCKKDTLRADSIIDYKRNVAYSFVPPYKNKGDAEIKASGGLLRRGQNYQLTLHLRNNGKPDLMVTPTVKFNKKLSFVSSSSTVATQSNNKIILAQQKASFFYDNKTTIAFYAPQDSFSVNEKVKFEIFLDSTNNETDLANNHLFYEETVRGPYDPNHISSNPENIIYNSPKEIQYTIEFQNLGNDTAFNVKIKDNIPVQYNFASLKILNHSAPQISATSNMGKVEFVFNGIKLTPSSVSQQGSKGFVTFSLELKDTLKPGQKIQNMAGIYFDYEPEVATNITNVTRLSPGSGLQSIADKTPGLIVYPNPANNFVYLEGSATGEEIGIYNLTGQLIYRQKAESKVIKINMTSWPSGIYFVQWGNLNSMILKTE